MRRRRFISFIGGVASLPLGAHAQDSRVQPARIGLLRSSPTPGRFLDALRRGLLERGYVEQRGYVFVPRYGDGDARRLPELAAALVAAGVDVIVTEGLFAARAARAATTTIPIVMTTSPDPVRAGLVSSLARPGGNVTGLVSQATDVSGKLLELLSEIVPKLARVALIMGRPAWDLFRAETMDAARALRLDMIYIELVLSDIDAAVRQAIAAQAQAAAVRGRPLFSTAQARLMVERAAAHRLPVIYESRDFVDYGGLASYGVDVPDLYRRAATFVEKILKGARPADLPIEQPTKFELVINLKTAKALGLTVPPTLLARVDEVIE
jgi:putative ABC transport system substrate-binding protein